MKGKKIKHKRMKASLFCFFFLQKIRQNHSQTFTNTYDCVHKIMCLKFNGLDMKN